jgi:hypothetical protein
MHFEHSSHGKGFAMDAAQLFEQGHGAAGGLAHVELAQTRELHHFAGTGIALARQLLLDKGVEVRAKGIAG